MADYGALLFGGFMSLFDIVYARLAELHAWRRRLIAERVEARRG